jgi:hypothetical protein
MRVVQAQSAPQGFLVIVHHDGTVNAITGPIVKLEAGSIFDVGLIVEGNEDAGTLRKSKQAWAKKQLESWMGRMHL